MKEYYNNVRQPLIDNGYTPLPIRPGEKRPAIKDWTKPDYTPPKGYGGHGAGIVCGGGLIAVDIDVLDTELSETMEDLTREICGETIDRIGKAPKRLFLFRTDKPIRKKTSRAYQSPAGKCQVEILGQGQQFVGFGTHPDTGREYEWPGPLGSLLDVRAEELPLVTLDQLNDVIKHFEELAESRGWEAETSGKVKADTPDNYDPEDPLDREPPIDIEPEELRAKLGRVDPDCSHDEWNGVGMALHHQFNGDEQGLDIWTEWSRGGEKYRDGETAVKWASFGDYRGRPLTAAFILKLAKGTEPAPESRIFIPSWDNEPPETDPLLSMNMSNVLTRENFLFLIAPAGTGKSNITSAIWASPLQCAEHDTLGFTSPGNLKTLFIDTEMATRDSWVTRARGLRRLGIDKGDHVPDEMHWINIRALETPKEKQKYFFSLIDCDDPPDLIILDGAGDLVNDVNNPEEVSVLVSRFCSTLQRRKIAAVVTLHTNPTENSTKARGHLGSELWRKAQCTLIIERQADGVRKITSNFAMGKNRNDTDNLDTYFRWCDERRMHVSCEAPVTAPKYGKTITDRQKIPEAMGDGKYSYSELKLLIMEVCGVQERAASGKIADLVQVAKINKLGNVYEVAQDGLLV